MKRVRVGLKLGLKLGLRQGMKLCLKLRLILGFGSTLGWMYEEKSIYLLFGKHTP